MRKIQRHIHKNSSTYSKGGLVFGFIFAQTASLTFDMAGFPWDYSYDQLIAMSFVMFLFSAYLLVTNNTPKWSLNWQTFALFLFISPLASLADEIAQSASEKNWSDLFHFIAVLTYVVIWRIRKGGNKKWKS